MQKYFTLALLPLGCAVVTGCSPAPLEADPDTPTPQPRRVSSYVTPTPFPRIVGKPAPLLAKAVVIPAVRLPNPNGYDLLVKAAESVIPGGEGTPSTTERLSPEEDLKRQRAFTKKNAASLDLVRRGLKLLVMVPPKRGIYGKEPPHSKLRMLTRVVLQENAVFAADGKPDLAVSGGLDVIQMGVALQNGANRIGMLVGLAIEAMGRGDITRRRGELNAAQALAASKRLQSIGDKRPSYASLQQEVMWSDLASMRTIINDPGWRKPLDAPPEKFGLFRKESERATLRKISDLQIESNFMAASQALIEQARQPYSPKLPAVPDPVDAMSALFVSIDTSQSVTRSRVNYERNSAAHRMLMTELALQAFEKTSGKYPASLDELVPKYLSQVPRDPFRPASPLGYKISLGNALLYSVGPDGVDDGGAPMTKRGIALDSKGDMISGVEK